MSMRRLCLRDEMLILNINEVWILGLSPFSPKSDELIVEGTVFPMKLWVEDNPFP
jgi:hypothetical protein